MSSAPDPDDATIARLADPEWLDWMRRNFTEPDDVAELGGARSYARRLRDYGGRDQVAWVIERLADPECRSAAITTFEPHTDTTYVPCISLLDFWRVSGAARARRVRALARLRQEGVRQPRRARAAAARGGRRGRLRGRLARRPREVGARLRARARVDGGALRVTVAIRRATVADVDWLVELLNGEETEPYLSGARPLDREAISARWSGRSASRRASGG